MGHSKLFIIPDQITKDNFKDAIDQAIALELATIPTYLSTYYSINRAQDQDQLYDKLVSQIGDADKAQELKKDILVYANQSAALIMSVVIEEMLHMALASNVKHAITGEAPDLMAIGKGLTFPTQLDGHEPEFPINRGPLCLSQLSTFLQIESPNPFNAPNGFQETDTTVISYPTIGRFYDMIIQCVVQNYPGPYNDVAQLLPTNSSGKATPYYSQNSINSVYYDRDHNPQFGSADDSGGLIGVTDADSAVRAMQEISEQGEGNSEKHHHILRFDGATGLPIPIPVVDGKLTFFGGDYDDASQTELSHYSKFLEIYSWGVYYQQKFFEIDGLDNFFSYFVANQGVNSTHANYASEPNVALMNRLGNAFYTYLLLMVETCYYKDEHTQFKVFMYGIHKTMIWLLSEVGNKMRSYSVGGMVPSLTFEFFDFSADTSRSPKQQILDLAKQLAESDPNWAWMEQDPYKQDYLLALPDVSLDHEVAADVPAIPAH